MALHVMCIASGGLPIFTRKKGECENLPFSTVASLNGTHMFCKSQLVELKSTITEDWTIVWKDYENSITLIVIGKNSTEKSLTLLLELIYNSFIMFIGFDEIHSTKLFERMKREGKNYIPIVDKLMENIENDLLGFSDCILTEENNHILNKLNEFSTQVGSLFCSIVINSKISAATEGWWDLDVIDRKLLLVLLNSSNSAQKDVPIFLPKKNSKTAYRFLSVPIIGSVILCVICGADPSYEDINLLVHQIWKTEYESLQKAERCIPRNFPESLNVDPNILGILLVNNYFKKYVISRNLQQSACSKRTLTGSHRLDILRNFFHQAIDIFDESLQDATKNEQVTKVTETYWCTEYHKCHAYKDDLNNLICVLFVASVPTHTMRFITYKLLELILQEKTICWMP